MNQTPTATMVRRYSTNTVKLIGPKFFFGSCSVSCHTWRVRTRGLISPLATMISSPHFTAGVVT